MSDLQPEYMGTEAQRLATIDELNIVHPWMAQSEYRSTIITSASGCKMWDTEGREYLDLNSQAWFANIGLGDKRVAAAITEQATDVVNLYSQGTIPKIALTEKLLSLLPGSYSRIFYGCNGTDAVEAALKTARVVTGRQGVISFWHQYHGASMGATSVTGLRGWRDGSTEPVPGTYFVDPPYLYRNHYGAQTQSEADTATIEALRRTIEQAGPSTIAAVIGEPFPTGGAPVIPGLDYWQSVRQLCDEYGILLIADEVVTAFARVGQWFARDLYDYLPDIICLGKGLTSGYLPLSAAVLRQDLSSRLNDIVFKHGLTYSGHPLCCAAALANIAVIEEDNLLDVARQRAQYLSSKLQDLQRQHASIGCIGKLGLFATIELVKDGATKQPMPDVWGKEGAVSRAVAGSVMQEMRKRGVICRGRDHYLKIAPAPVISEPEIDAGIAVLSEVLEELDQQCATS